MLLVSSEHFLPDLVMRRRIATEQFDERTDPDGKRRPLDVQPPPLFKKRPERGDAMLRLLEIAQPVERRRGRPHEAGGPARLHPGRVLAPAASFEIEQLDRLEQIRGLRGGAHGLFGHPAPHELVAPGDPGLECRHHVGRPFSDDRPDQSGRRDGFPAQQLFVGGLEFIHETADSFESQRRSGCSAHESIVPMKRGPLSVGGTCGHS